MKKKTYVFDGKTLEVLNTLKIELGKKETQIIREALRLYYENQKNHREILLSAKDMERRLSEIERRLDKIEELLREIRDRL